MSNKPELDWNGQTWEDAAETVSYFDKMATKKKLNDTAAAMADHWNRVERATMAIIESLEAGRGG